MKIAKNPKAAKSPAALEIAEEANTLLAEANSNTQAMIDTISAIIRAETEEDVIRATLDMIRKEFDWCLRVVLDRSIRSRTCWSSRRNRAASMTSFSG